MLFACRDCKRSMISDSFPSLNMDLSFFPLSLLNASSGAYVIYKDRVPLVRGIGVTLKMSSSLLNDDPSLVDLLPPEPSNVNRLMLATRYSKALLEENRSLKEEVEQLKDESLQLKRVTFACVCYEV